MSQSALASRQTADCGDALMALGTREEAPARPARETNPPGKNRPRQTVKLLPLRRAFACRSNGCSGCDRSRRIRLRAGKPGEGTKKANRTGFPMRSPR